MTDKCNAHDDCLGRIHKKIEDVLEKLDDIKDDLHEWRRAADVRFAQIEMRLAQCEAQLKASASGRMDAKRKAVGSLIDLLKMAVIAIVGAALWAFANGYRG